MSLSKLAHLKLLTILLFTINVTPLGLKYIVMTVYYTQRCGADWRIAKIRHWF